MGALKLSDITFGHKDDPNPNDVSVYDVLHNLKFWGTGPLLAIFTKASEELGDVDGNHQVGYALLDEAGDKIIALDEALKTLAEEWNRVLLVRKGELPETDGDTETVPGDTMDELGELKDLLEDGIMVVNSLMDSKGG